MGMMSQGLSSVGNFLTLVVAARVGTSGEFGHVAFAMAAYSVLLAASRALVSEPLTIRHQSDQHELRERNALTGGLLLAGTAGAVLVSCTVASGTASANEPLIWLGVSLPLLIWLDVQRFQWFAVGQPGRSTVLDAAWLLLLVVGLVLRDDVGSASVWSTWCVAGALTGLFAMVLSRGPGNLRRSCRWLRSNTDLGVRLLVETASTVLAFNLAQLVFAAVAGTDEVGAVRGALALFGPLTVLYLGVYPVLVGRAQSSRAAMLRVTGTTTMAMVAGAVSLTVVLALLPSSIGQEILGETWHATHDIILVIGLAMAASVASAGALLGLRALGEAQASMSARLISAVPTLVLPVVLGAVFSAAGFAVGLLISVVFATGLLWRFFHSVLPKSEWATTQVDAV